MQETPKQLLQSLGLFEEEAEIYLRIIEKPEGENIDSLLTGYGIQAEKAQKAVSSLAERGLVRIVSNRVEPYEPKVSLARILEQRRAEAEKTVQEANRLSAELERVLGPKYWEGRLGIRPEEILEPLRDLREMEIRTARIVGNATKEIFVFAQTFGWYEKLRESMFQAHDRGVKARILMLASDESSKNRAKELRTLGFEVRHCAEDWYPVRGTLVDNQELVFLIWATEKKISKPVYYRPHYTTNGGLIRVFSDAFRKRWEEGQPI